MELSQVSGYSTFDHPSSLTTTLSNIPNDLVPGQKYTFHIRESSSSYNGSNKTYSKIRTFLGFVTIGEKEYIEVERAPYRIYLIDLDRLLLVTAIQ